VTVRQGKGAKDRMTVLPKSLREEVAEQIERARAVWQEDRKAGLAGVWLPGALARKFRRARIQCRVISAPAPACRGMTGGRVVSDRRR
jgi:hypothetical protein